MATLPLGALRYFQSGVFSGIPPGQHRDHSLRFDVWSRIRVLDGTLRLVPRGGQPRVVHAGELLDVEPGLMHHLETTGRDLRFVVQLYRTWPDTTRIDVARWENEGGTPQR